MTNGKKTSGRRSSKYEAPKQRRITKQQIENATYKDVKLLEKFVSDRGKIRSSLITGITSKVVSNFVSGPNTTEIVCSPISLT